MNYSFSLLSAQTRFLERRPIAVPTFLKEEAFLNDDNDTSTQDAIF
ncbi:MAG: hypothetical protein JNM63_18005 [Spirochaetia bacterium]|nr:hypothetical protein [Spirochaetia bacterium]